VGGEVMDIVFFTDKNFEYMAEYLIKSINIQKIDVKLIYYTINFESTINQSNLIKKLWDLDSNKPRFEFYKPSIFLDALDISDDFIFLDTDIIIGHRFDINKFKHDLDYPLASIGNWQKPYAFVHYPNGHEDVFDEQALMKYLGVPFWTTDYVYTCFMSINKNCRDFLEEWKSFCENSYLLKRRNVYYPLHDETSFNVLLWKRNAKYNYGRIYLNTLFFKPMKFIEETENYQGHVFDVLEQYCDNSNRVIFYHGMKDKLELDKAVNYLQEKAGIVEETKPKSDTSSTGGTSAHNAIYVGGTTESNET
jgi:hypothetical protein